MALMQPSASPAPSQTSTRDHCPRHSLWRRQKLLQQELDNLNNLGHWKSSLSKFSALLKFFTFLAKSWRKLGGFWKRASYCLNWAQLWNTTSLLPRDIQAWATVGHHFPQEAPNVSKGAKATSGPRYIGGIVRGDWVEWTSLRWRHSKLFRCEFNKVLWLHCQKSEQMEHTDEVEAWRRFQSWE